MKKVEESLSGGGGDRKKKLIPLQGEAGRRARAGRVGSREVYY